jgi:hypothetical protein
VVEGAAHDYNFLPENCVDEDQKGCMVGEHRHHLHGQ